MIEVSNDDDDEWTLNKTATITNHVQQDGTA